MADNLTLQTTVATAPSGSVIATDDAGAGGHVQLVKLAISTDGSATALTADNTDGLLVNLGTNNDVTVSSGTITTITNDVNIADGGNSITVDNAALSVTGGGLEATALRVTIASDSTGVLSVDDGGGTLSIDDGGGAITVDGTVTANLSATDNAVLDSIDTNTSTVAFSVKTVDGTSTGSDSLLPMGVIRDDALSAGAGVSADGDWTHARVNNTGALWIKPDGDVAIADGGNSITVDAANDGSLNVTVGDGSNTATIRNLASNDALNVAIVDGAGNQVTSFGGSGGTSATDDAAFTAGSGSGTPAMGFASSDTVNSGDVGVLAMNTSRALHVSIQEDGVGIGGGTQYAEDTAHNTGDTGTLALVVRNDTLAALAGTDGDYAPLQVDASGALYIQEGSALDVSAATVTVTGTVTADAGTGPWPVTDNGGSLTVDGTVTANLSATDNAVLDQIETNTSYGDNVGNGTAAGSLRVTVASDTTGVLSVDDNGGSITVDNGGTFATQVDNIDGTEDAAADANPTGAVMIAVRDDEVGSTAVTSADGDYSALRTDRFGNLKVTQIHDSTSEVKYAVIDDATSGNNTIVAAAGAGVKIRVLAVMMIAAGDVTARFEDGASGTALTGQMDLTTNSGFTLPYSPVGWFEGSDNTLLNLELDAAVSVDGCLVYVEV